MTTERQVRANRLNALKSTGPRTEYGKAVSRRNALRHGLTAHFIVLDGEDAAAFETLGLALRDEYRPASATESDLVEHLAALLWRLRRAGAYEAALLAWIAHHQAETHDGDGMTLGEHFIPSDRLGIEAPVRADHPRYHSAFRLRIGRMLEVAVGQRDMLSKLGRYEAHLMRQIERVLGELKRDRFRPRS